MKKLILRYQVWLMWRRLKKEFGVEKIDEWLRAIDVVWRGTAKLTISATEAAAALQSLFVKMEEAP